MSIQLRTNLSAENAVIDAQGKEITACDQPENKSTLREDRNVELPEIANFFSAYKDEVDNLPPTFKDKALKAANFLASDIQAMIDQNSADLLFLRVYLGIDAKGDHVLCMAPVNSNKEVVIDDGTIYTIQCCGNPPHTGNFVNDPILPQ